MSFLRFLFAAALTGSVSLFAQSSASPVDLRLEVDRPVLPADSSERAIVKIGLDCIRLPRREARPPVNLAVVIDRSGSMGGEKIARAREAALELVRRLAPDDIVSIIAFDTEVDVMMPARRVGDGRGLAAAIRRIEARGNTALYGGVARGAEEIRKHIEDAGYVHRIILVSDGLANVGPSSPEELGRLGASLVKEGISVSTIGLGLDYNEDLMARLAQRSDGNTYFVENSSDLPGIFAAELGDVLNVVARRVVISIEFPDGVRPVAFVGREGSIRGQHAEWGLNQLYGGQEKYALVEVEVAPGRGEETREIAQAEVRYEDALAGRSVTLQAKQQVAFTHDRRLVITSANQKVQVDYASNVLAVAKDRAIHEADAGNKDEAAKRLRDSVASLNSLASTYGNSAVAGLAAAAAPEADRLEKDGLGNLQRKAYRAESFQTTNQQATSSSKH